MFTGSYLLKIYKHRYIHINARPSFSFDIYGVYIDVAPHIESTASFRQLPLADELLYGALHSRTALKELLRLVEGQLC